MKRERDQALFIIRLAVDREEAIQFMLLVLYQGITHLRKYLSLKKHH
jgi:hypothetical protein